jgi:hypothetical protein
MKKRFYVIGLVMGGALCAQAEDQAPILEFGAEYQMLRVNSSSAIPAFTANGGTGSVQVDFFDHVAGVLEVGVQHNGNIHDIHISNEWLTYMVGPRISLRNRGKRIVPSLEALFGGATVFGSGTTPGGVHLSANTTGFAMALGGVLDIRLTHHVALRPIQLDWLLTRINNDTNQHNLRYGAGLIFTFGEQ